ncbi:farnesol dehydrogenase-like [Planococcus citri]|uniref:farnesol dehydrogenase-like n=1 Tax=Planococcus citri TaxID=170843 RepID=UPI0031F7E0A6
MEKFANKVAIVTGSSSGIGSAITTELVKHGVLVVGVARRIDRLKKIADDLNEPGKAARFYPLKCDVTVESEIEKSFKWITSEIGPVAIMVNNAGVLKPSLLKDVTAETISQIFDTNVKASILWAKLVVESMTKNSIEGHIININSVAGHMILGYKPNLIQVYTASKYAQKVYSEGLRRELVSQNADIKVTNLSPGAVLTEMLTEFESAAGSLPASKIIAPKDIADACIYVLSTPPNVLVSELTIMPLHQEV